MNLIFLSYVILFVCFQTVSLWSAVTWSWLTAISVCWVQAILLPQPPKYLGLQVHMPHPANFCIFSRDGGFHHVGEADLKLLTSSDLPTWPPKVLRLQAWVTAPSCHMSSFLCTAGFCFLTVLPLYLHVISDCGCPFFSLPGFDTTVVLAS